MSYDITISNGTYTESHNQGGASFYRVLDDHFPDMPKSKSGLYWLEDMTTEEAVIELKDVIKRIDHMRFSMFEWEDTKKGDQAIIDHYDENQGSGLLSAVMFLSNIMASCATIKNGKISVSS